MFHKKTKTDEFYLQTRSGFVLYSHSIITIANVQKTMIVSWSDTQKTKHMQRTKRRELTREKPFTHVLPMQFTQIVNNCHCTIA